MTSGLAQRLHLRKVLVGVPVVAVTAVLSAAAVVGLVREPSADFAAVDAASTPSADVSADVMSESKSGDRAPASTELPPVSPDQLPSDLPDIGTYARASVGTDGEVVVTEWVRAAAPTTTLTLSLPVGSPASGLAKEVVVLSDEGTATGPDEVTSTGSYDFAQPSTLFVARYVLSGVTEMSPTSPTRALVQPIALSLAVGPAGGEPVGGPRLLSVESGRVLALACSVPGNDTALTPCGAPLDEGWQVELDSTRWADLVAAQVDLD